VSPCVARRADQRDEGSSRLVRVGDQERTLHCGGGLLRLHEMAVELCLRELFPGAG